MTYCHCYFCGGSFCELGGNVINNTNIFGCVFTVIFEILFMLCLNIESLKFIFEFINPNRRKEFKDYSFMKSIIKIFFLVFKLKLF